MEEVPKTYPDSCSCNASGFIAIRLLFRGIQDASDRHRVDAATTAHTRVCVERATILFFSWFVLFCFRSLKTIGFYETVNSSIGSIKWCSDTSSFRLLLGTIDKQRRKAETCMIAFVDGEQSIWCDVIDDLAEVQPNVLLVAGSSTWPSVPDTVLGQNKRMTVVLKSRSALADICTQIRS